MPIIMLWIFTVLVPCFMDFLMCFATPVNGGSRPTASVHTVQLLVKKQCCSHECRQKMTIHIDHFNCKLK